MEVFQQVRRENLERFLVGRIGGGTQGDIYKVSVDGITAAVKDISTKNILIRLLIGRWLLSREFKIYQKLQGIPGIPRLIKIIDRDSFIFELIEGIPLSRFAKDDPLLPPEFFNRLSELVQNIHARGVVHSDLKHKKNILVNKDYQPYLIDFGASWSAGASWNLPKRWLYNQFHQIDLNAVSKIRHRYIHGHPGTEDRKSILRRNVMEKCSTIYQWFYRLISRKHKVKKRRRPSAFDPDK